MIMGVVNKHIGKLRDNVWVQVEADGEEYWGTLLDRLSELIMPQEEAAVRQAAMDRGSPSHLQQLHNLVADLLVKHRLTSWTLLRTTFPEYYAGGGMGGVQGRQPACARSEREAGDAAVVAGVATDSRKAQGGGGGQGTAAFGADGAGRGPLAQQQLATDTRKCHERVTEKVTSGRLKRKLEGGVEEAEEHTLPHRNEAKTEGLSKRGKGSTLADYPRIVDWWHPTKNGTDLPSDYTSGSHKRVWLQCPGCPTCGEVHQWDATANELTIYGREVRCQSCAHRGRSFCSCVAISANQRLAAEWHEDNPPAATVYQGSNKKFKWRCADAACGHVWEAKPCNRGVTDGTNCPKCAVSKCTQRKHPSVAVGRPELLAEWDEEKNTLLPTEVTLGSMRKVWWLCPKCETSWESSVHGRAIRGYGCQKCNRDRHK